MPTKANTQDWKYVSTKYFTTSIFSMFRVSAFLSPIHNTGHYFVCLDFILQYCLILDVYFTWKFIQHFTIIRFMYLPMIFRSEFPIW